MNGYEVPEPIRNSRFDEPNAIIKNGKVGRVTPCAPTLSSRCADGAHGVTRPTNLVPQAYRGTTPPDLDRAILALGRCQANAPDFFRELTKARFGFS